MINFDPTSQVGTGHGSSAESSFNSSISESMNDVTTEDMIVVEEAKEWKETHSSPMMSSPPTSLHHNMSPPLISPIAKPQININFSRYIKPEPTEYNNAFSHYQLTNKGLLRIDDVQLDTKRFELPRCDGCKKTFSSGTNLTNHSCDSFKCGECNFACNSEAQLEAHFDQHSVQKYRCGLCATGFNEGTLLEQHLASEHGTPYTCPSCQSVFVTSLTFESHVKEGCVEKEWSCGECEGVFVTKDLLKEHLIKVHMSSSPAQSPPPGQSPLDLYTQTMLLQRELLQRLVSNIQNGITSPTLPTKPIARLPTNYKFSPLQVADSSQDSNDNFVLTPYTCTMCPATFSNTSQLHNHLVIHQLCQTSHNCEECGRGFLNAQLLEEHTKTHDSERPFSCSHCDKTFTRSNNLQEHLRTHTGSRPYICNICDKRFARSSILHIHMRTHTKLKPFQCHVCPAAFSHSNSLQAHLRRHTGAKPYVCPVCAKPFRQSGTLHRHIRTHSKVKNARGSYAQSAEKSPEYSYSMQTASTTDALKLFQDCSPSLNKENRPDITLNSRPDIQLNTLQLLQQLQARTMVPTMALAPTTSV